MRAQFTSLLLVLIFFFSIAAAFAGNPVTNTPVLKVDKAHWMSKAGAGSEAYTYRIMPSASIILDATHFNFVPPEGLKGEQPNCVTVDFGDPMDGFHYLLKLQSGTNRFELSAMTLPQGKSPLPFSGFRKSHVYAIQIGGFIYNVTLGI